MCSDFPESLVGLLLGVGVLGWPPGLGEDCREMKEGSLQRLPEPVPAEAASSGTDSSSRSRGREAEGEEGERREGEDGGEEGEGGEEEEWGEETEEEEAEAAAKSRGEGGVEAEPAAAEVGQLDVCLVGRWAAKDFLGPWLVEALLLGGVMLGSGAGAVAARRPRCLWLRWSSWHWAPRGQTPLREKSGHSSVCFFLHFAPSGQ